VRDKWNHSQNNKIWSNLQDTSHGEACKADDSCQETDNERLEVHLLSRKFDFKLNNILRKKIKAIGAIGDAESPTLEILIGFAKPPEGICWNGNIWYRFLFEQSLEMGTKHFLVKFCYTIKLFDILIREHNLSICIVVMLNKVDIDTITDMSTSNPCAGRTIIFKDRKIFSGP
jgi:hypothetical protein